MKNINAAPTVAYCEKCGRGFVSLPKVGATDPYTPPDRYKAGDREPCGGKIIRSDPL